jgi:hypothetical protein
MRCRGVVVICAFASYRTSSCGVWVEALIVMKGDAIAIATDIEVLHRIR